MEEGSNMANHIDRFDEHTLSMEEFEGVMDEYRKVTILLESLPADYELKVMIINNSNGLTLMGVKEKLMKEYEKKRHRETSEGAFRVNHGQGREHTMLQQQERFEVSIKKTHFRERCHSCKKVGHNQCECKMKTANKMNEVAFTVHGGGKQGWLLDRGAW
uniref:Putative polyprotein n=1 Tax=Albugo laibachii Nc14 TaxID=890382 RepID=F0W958_9STRA|nr:putative polyprotein [Albugo laibachii Nc14]|eukprot:CCA17671.1 putative polyprotein [Albugo laibachii Nc14]